MLAPSLDAVREAIRHDPLLLANEADSTYAESPRVRCSRDRAFLAARYLRFDPLVKLWSGICSTDFNAFATTVRARPAICVPRPTCMTASRPSFQFEVQRRE